eukprot:4862639-Pyramimonas_sp.AAC.1
MFGGIDCSVISDGERAQTFSSMMDWSLRPQSASVAAPCQISNEIAAFRMECDFSETKARSLKEK